MVQPTELIPENRIQQLLNKLEKDAIIAGLSPKEIFRLKEDCQKVLKKEGTFNL